ncbi:MAG: DUF885 domain-containing protein [Chloroflexia bacterium]
MDLTAGAEKSAFYADVQEFTAWYLARNPVAATELGLHAHDSRLAETSPEALHESQVGLALFLERVGRYSALGDTSWEIDLRLMAGLARSGLRALVTQDLPHRSPDFYGAEALYGPCSLLLRDFAPLEDRLRSLAGRLAEVPRVLADAERNLGVCPRLWVELASASALGGLLLFQSMIPPLAAGMRSGDPMLAARLEATNTKAVAAVERYVRFLRETLLPRAEGDFVLGEAAWNALVHDELMLDLDAGTAGAMGRELIREAEDALQADAAALGNRPWPDLLTEIHADHPLARDLLPAYQQAIEAARAAVIEHDLVTLPPDEHLHIAETPTFMAPLVPPAAYLPAGPFERKQLGIFRVTPVPTGLPHADTDCLLRAHPSAGIPAVAVREAYPGRHLQLACAAWGVSLPRKLAVGLGSSVTDAWTFYAEDLMEQAGFLTDPRGRLLRLADGLHRACRIVIDVGLHSGEMSLDDAAALLVETAHLEPPTALAEAARATQSPNAPLSYLIAKRELPRLAADYRAGLEAAGWPFALKAFHDELLALGSLPIGLLRMALLG